jgi:hypothetical protein
VTIAAIVSIAIVKQFVAVAIRLVVRVPSTSVLLAVRFQRVEAVSVPRVDARRHPLREVPTNQLQNVAALNLFNAPPILGLAQALDRKSLGHHAVRAPMSARREGGRRERCVEPLGAHGAQQLHGALNERCRRSAALVLGEFLEIVPARSTYEFTVSVSRTQTQ